MSLLLRVSAGGLCALLAAGAVAQGTSATGLAITATPRLVDCAPVSLSPCMTASFTPVLSSGVPAPVSLPPGAQLNNAFTITGTSGQTTPFYASAGQGPDAAQHTNVVLMVIDISGSMNQPVAGGKSRFEAARDAIARFVDGMQEGSDRIAIVPFESHNVVPTIRSAVFATRKADALAQLRALPQPGAKNNTALYQAVYTGVQAMQDEVGSLQRAGAAAGEPQPHLIVMTDGRNEVAAGDDPQLLNGDLGLQQAAAQVQASHLDVIGIGFGDRSAIDTSALQRLSSRFFYAESAQQLLDALHISRVAVSHSIAVTWLVPEDSRVSLTGRDIPFVVSMKLQDGSVLTAPSARYLVPATASPVFERRALVEELRALIATHPEASSGWSVVIMHGLVYLGLSVLLLMLWFWLPRLIWGDRYEQAKERTQRWSSDRPGVTAASGVQVRSTNSLPAGFVPDANSGGSLQRSAAQTTQIQPRGEFSRTRLTFNQK